VGLLRVAPDAEALVGREAELQALREALTTTSGPVGILLEGEPGIGKTALWLAGVAEAEARGMRVLTARPVEAETGLAHAALGDLLAPLIDEVGDELSDPQRHAMDVALLRAEPQSGPVDARAVGAATLTVVRGAAAKTTIVLAIDDVQWLDSASRAALAFTLRRLRGEPVVLLASARGAPEAERLELGLTEDRYVRIGVGALPADVLQRMLQRRLGDSISWPALARLSEASGGNPYYALELARAALRQAGDGAPSPELPLPGGIHAVLQERLGALPPETTDALGTLAAMGRATVATAATAVDPGALDAAFGADVVREDGDTIRFDHPLLADTAYRMLPPSRRRAVHERLAELADDAEQRARHLAAASAASDAGVAADIEAGAAAAAARGAPAAAAELLETAARLEPDSDLAARRRIDAVRHHIAAGDGRRATALAIALIEELPAGPLRARALVACTDGEGPLEQMLGFARQAVEEAGADEEALVGALLSEGLSLALQDRYDDALKPHARAYELCGPGTERTLRVKAMSGYAKLAYLRGQDGAMELLREAAELEGDDLIPNAYWGPGMLLGRALMYSDQLDAARPLLERRRRRAIDVGDDESRAGLCLHLAELEIRAGRFDVAQGYAEEGLAIQRASYGELAQGSLPYVLALTAAHKGDAELARELGEQALAQSESLGDVVFAAIGRTTLGFLELSLSDHRAAVEWLWPVAERFRSSPTVDPGLPHIIHIPDAVEALVGVARSEDAETLLAVWERVGERDGRPRVRATAARGRALLAAERGELDSALVHAVEALEHHRELAVPFERARTLIVLGSLQRRLRQKAAARASLGEALASLEAMGAALWADRARAELARIGGRARTSGLTPTEERVAELVAEGRSNKQVADALFVSVRTVEANLTRIYAKLGIHSRTELAAGLLAQQPPPAGPR
jgi:DNA-binding CsgD family transcriptional regulator